MASAVILAGGDARRLGGIDKATVTVGGQTLLERELAVVQPLVDEVIVVASRSRQVPAGVKLALDLYPGKGPLGGLYTGLASASGSHCLVLACDLPFLNQSLLAYLLGLASEFDAVVPRTNGRVHALAAVYSKQCLGQIEPLLRGDRLKVVGFFDRVRLRYVDEPEIDRLDPTRRTFFNVNTRDDLTLAAEIAS